MTRWFMMAGLLGATSMVANEAYAQDNTGAKKKQAAKNKKGKKGGKDKPDGIGPFKKKDYPLAERLRPLVLPDGMGEIGLDLPISTFSIAGESTTTFGAALSFNYGLGDQVELGLAPVFALLLSPDVLYTKQIGPRVAWLAYDSKEFDFAPAVTIPLTFEGDTGIGVNIDLFGRYVLSDGLFVFFGQGALPVAVAPDFALGLNANGGLGWQASPKAALLFSTTPISFLLVPDVAVTGLWENLNIAITGQYTPAREWDIGATLAPNYFLGQDGADGVLFLTFDLFARFRF